MEWQCCSRFWIQLIVLSLSLGMLLWFIFHILDEEIQETKSSSKKDQQKDSDIEILIFLRYLVGFSVCLLILAVLAKVYTRYFIRNQASSQETFMGQFMRRELRRLPRRISSFHMDLMMRDFTSADYELLQRLDDDIESNKKRKAAEHEISRLPHFTLTAKDVSCLSNENKTCAICLEPFEVKEVVKIVPCLHRYHIKCIDTWLREHAICPICKFPVTDV